MDRTEIQKLRDLPIEEVAGRLGLRVNRHTAPPDCKDFGEYYIQNPSS